MKSLYRNLSLLLSRLTWRHIWLALVILSLALFVLGAGAPGDYGGH